MKVNKVISKTVVTFLSIVLMASSQVSNGLVPLDPVIPPINFGPSAPTNLTGTFDAEGNIILTWNDCTNETSYEILRENGSDQLSITVGANLTTIKDETQHPIGETFIFKIRAKNTFGTSAWSNIVSFSCSKPTAPSNLKGKFEADGSVTLTWNDNSNNEFQFEVSMEEGGNGGSVKVGSNVTTYKDTVAHSLGKTYTYSVRAINAFGNSSWTGQLDMSPAKPAAPSALTAILEANGNITVKWNDNSSNETAFEVSITEGSSGNVVSLPINITTYIDTMNHVVGKTYAYKIRSKNAFGTSNWSNIGTVVIPAQLVLSPTAPSNLIATLENNGTINLSWTDNSTNEVSFEIDISDGSGGTSTVVGPNMNTYADTASHTVGKTYSYKVRAKGAVISSAWSNTSSVTIPNGSNQSLFDGTQSGWAESEIQQAFNYGLTYPGVIGSYKKPITREEFCTIVVMLYEKLSGTSALAGTNPFNDTTNPEIIKAVNLGIVEGKATDTFSPYDYIKREELCLMIWRCLSKADSQLDKSLGDNFTFNDASSIDLWALDAMKFCFKNNIIHGVGNGNIAPLANTKREEAISIIKRTFEEYK
ncbi:MAG: hypothetical protein CVU84_05775 [Firmicutes bacterium HGW-Firmicutes-1]|jgi:hypothetical protein|nr:MAG: hypothetical protein CVU84_05775 [Firmicutes bacterium HGW-Firmicutes-1]